MCTRPEPILAEDSREAGHPGESMRTLRRAINSILIPTIVLLAAGSPDLLGKSNLGGSNIKATGSPLDRSNCNSCHSAGTTNSNSTAVTLTGLPASWSSGTTYSLTLTETTGSTGPLLKLPPKMPPPSRGSSSPVPDGPGLG